MSQAESALRTELGTLTEKVEARFTAMGEKVEPVAFTPDEELCNESFPIKP